MKTAKKCISSALVLNLIKKRVGILAFIAIKANYQDTNSCSLYKRIEQRHFDANTIEYFINNIIFTELQQIKDFSQYK